MGSVPNEEVGSLYPQAALALVRGGGGEKRCVELEVVTAGEGKWGLRR